MACPSTTTLTGTGVVNVGFYSTTQAAETEAKSLVQSHAEIEAGLKFNAFHCPEQLCQQKTLGPVTAATGTVSSSLGLMASFFWLSSKYEGRAEFTWSAPVTCQGNNSPLLDQFLQQFAVAAAERYNQVDTIASDWLNNVLSWIGYGRGCGDWAAWIWGWFWDNGWPSQGVQIRVCRYWILPPFFQHQVAVITMPDGKEYVLDPYTNIQHPIWDREQYEREHGTLICPN